MSTVVERLGALRALMKEKNIQAYIICTDDFHGSEYVGDYFKARAFILMRLDCGLTEDIFFREQHSLRAAQSLL